MWVIEGSWFEESRVRESMKFPAERLGGERGRCKERDMSYGWWEIRVGVRGERP